MSPAALRPFGSTLGRLFPEFTAELVAGYATRPRPLPPRPQPEDAEPVTLRFGLTGLRWGHSGPRVLALHGWQGSAAQFAPIARALVGRGLQVLALDAPAHGRTPGEFASPTVFSDALLESRPELGSVEAVIGHSMGGGAVLYALAHGLRAERAVVVAAPAHYAEVAADQPPTRPAAACRSRLRRPHGAPDRRACGGTGHRRAGKAIQWRAAGRSRPPRPRDSACRRRSNRRGRAGALAQHRRAWTCSTACGQARRREHR